MTHNMKTNAFVRLAAGVAVAALMIAGCSQEGGNKATVKPALVQKDGTTHFEVDGKHFLMFTGELHNSTSTSESYMESIGVWEQMKYGNFNTVIASCSWDVIEDEPGHYDFTSVDHVIRNARKNGLKVVMIWFASWKNGNSTYAPSYIKRDPVKYPLVETQDGGHLNVLSAFCQESMEADKKAYVALMQHIKEIDPDYTVIMMQVENEMGILGSVRDFSPAAQKAWEGQVPADLMQYLSAHKGKLFPELERSGEETVTRCPEPGRRYSERAIQRPTTSLPTIHTTRKRYSRHTTMPNT